MTDPLDHPDTLSPAGAVRRDAMLSALRAEVPRAAASRRALRRASLAAATLAAGAAAWLVLQPAPTVPPAPIAIQNTQSTPTITLVRTDPSAAARLTVHSRADWSGVIVSDDELLLELEEMGRPAGLIRTGGKAWISALGTPADGS